MLLEHLFHFADAVGSVFVFRFGLSVPADEEAKKKARVTRFGSDVKVDSLEEEKRKARAIRFAASSLDYNFCIRLIDVLSNGIWMSFWFLLLLRFYFMCCFAGFHNLHPMLFHRLMAREILSL